MKYDTAGNVIYEPIQNCNCGLTGGCNLCRPSFIGSITDKEADKMKKKVADFKEEFDRDLEERNKKFFPRKRNIKAILNEKKRISLTQRQAQHLYELALEHFCMNRPIKFGKMKVAPDCCECSNLKKRLEKFIGEEEVRWTKRMLKKHPYCKIKDW
jgi:hypothetical protein